MVLLTANISFAADCEWPSRPTDYQTTVENFRKAESRCDPDDAKFNLEECRKCCDRIDTIKHSEPWGGAHPGECKILKDPPTTKTVKVAPIASPIITPAVKSEAVKAVDDNAQIEQQKQKEELERQQEEIIRKKEQIRDELEKDELEKENLFKNQKNLVASIENKKAAIVFLLGPDYKNIGQLRSELVKNSALSKKLQEKLNDEMDEESRIMIQEEIQQISSQQETINNVIEKSENVFSLFGWAFKFLGK
ncbi:MAG: hypothetical protein UW95_C0001G0053 [Parcubacteria group bacterium GW2011_GWC1_45_14]|nr:MAG: hypothetical protein UW87_C0004G0031 [Candidatus Moranbacteria bacterium GW2011_GWC2_45_10]KKT95489.1 MAG: hypothetical protein UW95_C0001G0053 [Parcubacteria group bacterium GW2011_GWC1_45_14]